VYKRQGEKRTVIELEVDEIGPSLKYANAKVNRTQRSGGAAGKGNSDGTWGGNQPATVGVSDSGGWGNGPDSEPPF